jgi:hypothetical protein
MAGEESADEGHRPGGDLVVEDLRSLRRWLVVLGVAAVAALGLAVYATLDAANSDSDTAKREKRLTNLENKAEEEGDVEKLEARLRLASEESDVVAIDRRLRRVERDVVDAIDASADAGQGIDRLQSRVDRLQARVARLSTRRP